MLKFLAECFKLVLFVCLTLFAIHLAGYWDPFMREVNFAVAASRVQIEVFKERFGIDRKDKNKGKEENSKAQEEEPEQQ
jgi:ABC-type proline/glycine betaine transport system permease subunit